MAIKTDLDIPVDDKLAALEGGTFDLWCSERDYKERGEDAFQPSHVADYEHWKKTNKRGKQ